MAGSDFVERIRKLSPAKLVLLAEQLQDRVVAAERARREAIAIVGIGCRFPGDVDDVESYWRLLESGTDAISEVPPGRWDRERLFDADPDAPGRMSTRWGGFVDPVDRFDAGFFGVAPREAGSLDPQQRLLLEVSWEALEHAGIAPGSLAGSSTGVFIGISGSDYLNMQLQAGLNEIDTYLASGTAHSIASGRIAYVLGLQGPTFSVDTACSSSLIAIHSAIQSLRLRECNLALAGGVNLILSPVATIALSKAHMMAPDGRCKAFDSRANGFVRSEGAGVLVLKRLSDALASNDSIVAVIRGSAINQDGRSNGLTAPNGPSQEAVIRAALDNAGVSAAQVGYVETHGTGTSLGDPIEAQALAAVLGVDRPAERPLVLGAVKTNIGHLESAAGVAGLIKAALVVQRGEIPRNLHLEQPNEHIDWQSMPFTLPREHAAWTAPGPRIAGVSSFGFSGSNAHLVLEQPPPASQTGQATATGPLVVPVSARSATALRTLASELAVRLGDEPQSLAAFSATLGSGRTHFRHRCAVVASDARSATSALEAVAKGRVAAMAHLGSVTSSRPLRVAFLFTGQGSQFAGMGRSLYDADPTFRATLDRCEAILAPVLARPLLSVMFGRTPEDAALLQDASYAQPALFALQHALAVLWQRYGVTPTAVLGHSIGEYAAACVAGMMSLEDALRLVAERGHLTQLHGGGGGMATVFASDDVVRGHLDEAVDIAAINGPTSTVISGPSGPLSDVCGRLRSQGLEVRPLAVTHGFHSRLMAPVQQAFHEVVARTSLRAPTVSFVSTLTGEVATASQVTSPGYWSRQLREPVRFRSAMDSLVALDCDVFLEIGPHPVLLGMAARWHPTDESAWLPSLQRGRDDQEQFCRALAALYVKGAAVDWAKVGWATPRPQPLRLPTYPFDRVRHWSASAGPAPVEAAERAMFDVRWDEVSERHDPADAAAFLSGLAARLTDSLVRRHAEDGLEAFERMLPQLDALCAAYVERALVGLGATFEPGQRLSVAQLMEPGHVLPRHRRLMGRLFEILAEDGLLEALDRDFVVRRRSPVAHPDAMASALAAQFPDAGAEIRLASRCGGALAEALRGEVEPLQLLFPGGSLDDTEQLYQKSPVARTYNAVVAEAFAEVVSLQASAGRPLRVLEIGGGTGGTTSALLPLLAGRRCEYVFTDASRLFLGKAREKFDRYPFLSFATLDISQDPLAQGFDRASFDIVVAANVLHATPDLRRTLAHVRGLLCDGGSLVLLESGSRTRYADVTVGLTEGWWSFTDPELRPDYALLDPVRWRTTLLDTGFDDVASAPRDPQGGILDRQAVIVAQAGRRGTEANADAGRWLVVGAEESATLLAGGLRRQGQRVVVASAGAGFARLDESRYAFDPMAPADCERLILESFGVQRPTAVVHAAALDAAEDDLLVTRGALHLAQAVAAGQSASLSFVTRGAQSVISADAPTLRPAHAPIWGLAHTVAQEHPELRCQRVDLDPHEPAAPALEALAQRLCRLSDEDQWARRGGRWLVRRLVPADAGSARPLRLSRAATYVVTGGLRGLGPTLARWLVSRGAAHLLLLGRQAPSPQSEEVLAELRRRGVHVHVAQADVSDAGALAAALAPVRAGELPPVRGVIHSAGTVDDAVLARQTWAHFERTMKAKVQGTRNVVDLVRDEPLDFLLLFSSGVSLLGSGGQANHAAANAYVDVLSAKLRAEGLPALTINWGAWDEVGAAVGRKLGSDQQGIVRMSPQVALRAMERSMRSSSAQVAVIEADWPRFFAQFGDRIPPLFAALATQAAAPSPVAAEVVPTPVDEPRAATLSLVERLRQLAPSARLPALRSEIRSLAGQVLGINSAGDIPLQQPLSELGLDSLMAVQLRNRLAAAAGRALPATLLFDCPTIAALVEFLSKGFEDRPDEAAVAAADDRYASASDDELAAALTARLDEIGAI